MDFEIIGQIRNIKPSREGVEFMIAPVYRNTMAEAAGEK